MTRLTKLDNDITKVKGTYMPYDERPIITLSNATYVQCLLNKLGKIEDIFELIEQMYKKRVYYKVDNGMVFSEYYTESTILYNPKTNEIEIYEYSFITSYKVEEYGKTWAFTKEKLRGVR